MKKLVREFHASDENGNSYMIREYREEKTIRTLRETTEKLGLPEFKTDQGRRVTMKENGVYEILDPTGSILVTEN